LHHQYIIFTAINIAYWQYLVLNMQMIKKGKKPNNYPAKKRSALISSYISIHSGIVEMLEAARKTVATSVNAIMTATYWEIGRRIVSFEQGGSERAEYGKMLIEKLSVDLTKQYKRGFAKANLWNMRAFYLAWPDEKILQTVSGELDKQNLRPPVVEKLDGCLKEAKIPPCHFPLPWSAYVRLLSVKDSAARTFYEKEAMRGGWSVRQLDRQINSLFYERTALSNNKVAMLKKGGTLSYDVETSTQVYLEFLKNPYWTYIR
jgi:DUF1016 N-terminal domain